MKIDFLDIANKVIENEIEGIRQLQNNLDENFIKACQVIKKCTGRIIIIGMGKSGHIGSKIAATFASTGTPSFFVHPAEAGHGDFGMITKNDIVIAISNSGSTPEVIQLIPLIKRLRISMIAMTGKENSILAREADIFLNISVPKEACPHNLAPTTSTTVTLILGDSLAIALLKEKGFTKEDFAFSHPSGALGKRLLLRVLDVMIDEKNKIPFVNENSNLEDTILEMSEKSFGMVIVSNDEKNILGIFTDGDLRRIFQKNTYNSKDLVKNYMTKQPKAIKKSALAVKALSIMEQNKITSLIVTNEKNEIEGIISLHDLLKQGI